jgi:hypothetical protein
MGSLKHWIRKTKVRQEKVQKWEKEVREKMVRRDVMCVCACTCMCIYLFTCWDCYNKVLQTEWLKKQKFIVLYFWRLDIYNQGVHSVGSFWGPWGKICSRPLSSLWYSLTLWQHKSSLHTVVSLCEYLCLDFLFLWGRQSYSIGIYLNDLRFGLQHRKFARPCVSLCVCVCVCVYIYVCVHMHA